MTRAPLNIFQKTQRLWDTLHPYNAAQLAELADDFSDETIDAAFHQAVTDLRLGTFVCTKRSYAIEPAGAIPCIRSTESADALLTRLVNEPFDKDRSIPFRPFIVRNGECPTIGLVYQHWVADSVSIRLLMRQWMLRLIDRGETAPVTLPRGGMWYYFSSLSAGWSAVAQISGLLGFAARMKRMRRIEVKAMDRSVAVIVRTLPDNIIQSVRNHARTRGATVGDVFIAAAAEAVAMHGPNTATERRPGLAMGSIVDPRARSKAVAPNIFGLFLGFTMTPFDARDIVNFDHLLERAAQQRRSDLRRHAAEASQLNMAIGYVIARTKMPKALLEFYRKRFPLAGGLSSVNLGQEWSQELHPNPITMYHRVSPTGPLMPIVLTPTTLGDRLSLCCTYQSGIVGVAQAEAVFESFKDRLVNFAKLAADEP